MGRTGLGAAMMAATALYGYCDKLENNNCLRLKTKRKECLQQKRVKCGAGVLRVQLVAGVIACVCYWNTLKGEFVHDDVFAIVKNKDVQLDSDWIDCFQHDFWGKDISSNVSHKSYRPLTVLSFR